MRARQQNLAGAPSAMPNLAVTQAPTTAHMMRRDQTVTTGLFWRPSQVP